jgi:hypothetical protein
MFCSRCGAENVGAQGFCRRCGLPLAAARLASDGRLDEALAKLGKGAGNITSGSLVFVIGLLNAALNGAFDAWLAAYVSILVGSAVGAPLFAVGLTRVRRAKRILGGEAEAKSPGGAGSLEGEARATTLLPEADAGAFDAAAVAAQDSVTEHTTLKLDPRGPAGRK